jgi:hypothetical protein
VKIRDLGQVSGTGGPANMATVRISSELEWTGYIVTLEII